MSQTVWVVTAGDGGNLREGYVVSLRREEADAVRAALAVEVDGCCSDWRWEEDCDGTAPPVRRWLHHKHWVQIVPWVVL